MENCSCVPIGWSATLNLQPHPPRLHVAGKVRTFVNLIALLTRVPDKEALGKGFDIEQEFCLALECVEKLIIDSPKAFKVEKKLGPGQKGPPPGNAPHTTVDAEYDFTFAKGPSPKYTHVVIVDCDNMRIPITIVK